MIRPLVSQLVFLAGVTLWVPGWAVFNVGGAWGLQPALLPALALGVLMALVWLGAGPAARVGMGRERALFFELYLAMLVLCTAASAVGVAKSAQTFVVEVIGLGYSVTMAWWLCRSPHLAARFFDGFRWAGLVSSGYAIYQVVGWRFGLPLTYLPMNNASFILEDPVSAQYLQRAFAVTPEPSVLACLLLPLLAMTTADVTVYGGRRRYGAFAVVGLAFLATGSQSLVTVPFFLLGVVLFVRARQGALRRVRRSDMMSLGAVTLAAALLLAANGSILQSLDRLAGREDNVSAATRFTDVLVGLEMFRERPLTGFGLGSSGAMMDSVLGKLGLTTGSGGITSGLLRVMAEQGLAGLAVLLAGAACLLPRRAVRGVPPEQAALFSYHAAFVLGTALAGAVFIGYRNLYQLWLIVPIGLSLKQQWRQAQAAPDAGPPARAGRAVPAIGGNNG